MEKRLFNTGRYYLEIKETSGECDDEDEYEYEPDFEDCRPGWKETVCNTAAVGFMMFCVLYFAAKLLPLETEVASFGHLKLLNGKIVVSASWIRVLS